MTHRYALMRGRLVLALFKSAQAPLYAAKGLKWVRVRVVAARKK